jgi:sulfur dioxygenase
MLLRQLFDAKTSTYTYLLADEVTRAALLIDPVREQVERDLTILDELGLRLEWVLETHVHADHVTAAGLLRKRTGAQTAASSVGAPCVDRGLKDGDLVQIGQLTLRALATPGHTDDGMSFLVDGLLFTGDTLLIRGCGRADFQNGDPKTLFHSITRVLFALPDDTIVLPGHDYKGRDRSTIGEERAHNPRVAGKTEAEFVTLMNDLRLPRPAQIDVAVPENRACGERLS